MSDAQPTGRRKPRYRRPRSRRKWLLVQGAAFVGLYGAAALYYGRGAPAQARGAAPRSLRAGARSLLSFEEAAAAAAGRETPASSSHHPFRALSHGTAAGGQPGGAVYPPLNPAEPEGEAKALKAGDWFDGGDFMPDVNCSLPNNPLSIVSALIGDEICAVQPIGGSDCAVCCTDIDVAMSPVWLFVVLYTFLGLAIICDDYFCESLDAISEALGLSEDVAGATFMAAGSSAPELFTALVTILITGGSEGP
jgi:hypothetical protein